MNLLKFDSKGKLVAIDQRELFEESGETPEISSEPLKTSESLSFIKESESKIGDIFEKSYWSLYENQSALKPLEFSNGKSQEDVVKEIYDLVQKGEKIIFLHGACGTGKSAIALNLARLFGKTSIVVPVKNLQMQYEKDYTEKKQIIRMNGKKLKVATITGRENHDSIIKPGISCADPYLPDTIKINEKNTRQVLEYYKENPLIRNHDLDLKQIKRISIAPANPYWSPIIASSFEAKNLSDAKKIKYMGCDGNSYTFHHRKAGCSYYDQYLAYEKADVIIFNSAKYNSEMSLGRKPLTDLDIIDESDVYLDNLFEQAELNLTRLSNSLEMLNPDSSQARESIREILKLIDLEEKNKQALGVSESQIFKISETKIEKIIEIIKANSELQSEIAIDEINYANTALEIARNFPEDSSETYITYKREESDLLIKIISTNLSTKIKDLLSKTKTLVLMSGTIHSEEVLKHIFKIENYKIVEAETINSGTVEITRTGRELDCKYSNFKNNPDFRERYLEALESCLNKSKDPVLIHVQAYQDLPSIEEKNKFNLKTMSKEDLLFEQKSDNLGKRIADFKQKKFPKLFSTRCSRGVDFPGEICRSIIFTKYPNPNVQDIIWKVLQETHPDYYWEFYRDKARREFLQRLYRGIRSKDDHVFILSPDIRVIRELEKIQREVYKK